ncbi:unnamed protein product [Cuscuta campestris]|uniref:Uncharacterized protein n=1 Tax=Cuscuta campestris TaxID=132261 RepID=A0A484NRR6_9ASTE|nr:unnamed protein product [Cuscuta campestris]
MRIAERRSTEKRVGCHTSLLRFKKTSGEGNSHSALGSLLHRRKLASLLHRSQRRSIISSPSLIFTGSPPFFAIHEKRLTKTLREEIVIPLPTTVTVQNTNALICIRYVHFVCG